MEKIVFNKSVLSCKFWTPLLFVVRNRRKIKHNFFPAGYLDPVSSKKELAIFAAEGKLEAMKLKPIKAAKPNVTDSLYDDPIFKKFTNMVMQWSDRTLARELMFETFARIKRIQLEKYHSAPEEEKPSIELNPLDILKQAIENCQPILGLNPIKKGGITYQVPTPITPKRSQWMSMKWLIMAARDKEGAISFVEQMSVEILDAFNHEGRVFKRKQDLHKVCESNKAYAHFRWS